MLVVVFVIRIKEYTLRLYKNDTPCNMKSDPEDHIRVLFNMPT